MIIRLPQVPPPIAACLMLGAGVILLFYGWRAYKVALVVVGALLGAALGAALARKLHIHPVIVALPMALAAGIAALMLQKVGVFLAGGACGLLLVASARGMFQNEWGFYVTAALAFTVGALLALYLWRPMITVSLALIGASLIAGGLIAVADMIKPGRATKLVEGHPFWLTAAMIAAAVFGVYFQTRDEASPETE